MGGIYARGELPPPSIPVRPFPFPLTFAGILPPNPPKAPYNPLPALIAEPPQLPPKILLRASPPPPDVAHILAKLRPPRRFLSAQLLPSPDGGPLQKSRMAPCLPARSCHPEAKFEVKPPLPNKSCPMSRKKSVRSLAISAQSHACPTTSNGIPVGRQATAAAPTKHASPVLISQERHQWTQ